jgi:hypothetical protein
MQRTFASSVVPIGAGFALGAVFALTVAQVYKKPSAPAPMQPVVRSLPRAQPDFALGPLPVADVDEPVAPRVARVALPQPQVQPVQVEAPHADVENEAFAAAQRVEDASLLQQQQAASERQQEELNQQIEQEMQRQQEVQAEPRIQGIPEIPMEQVPLEPTQPEL